jgi:hypothetical protein
VRHAEEQHRHRVEGGDGGAQSDVSQGCRHRPGWWNGGSGPSGLHLPTMSDRPEGHKRRRCRRGVREAIGGVPPAAYQWPSWTPFDVVGRCRYPKRWRERQRHRIPGRGRRTWLGGGYEGGPVQMRARFRSKPSPHAMNTCRVGRGVMAGSFVCSFVCSVMSRRDGGVDAGRWSGDRSTRGLHRGQDH